MQEIKRFEILKDYLIYIVLAHKYTVYVYIYIQDVPTEQKTILRQIMSRKEEIKFFHPSLCFREN